MREKDHGGDRVRLDQRLRGGVDLEAGILAGAEFGLAPATPTDDGFCSHDLPPLAPRRCSASARFCSVT